MSTGGDRKHELLAHEWTTLQTLWISCRPDQKTLDDNPGVRKEVEAIDRLFPTEAEKWQSGAEQWGRLNEAEQRIGRFLTADQLAIEFRTLLARARERSLPSLKMHESNEKLFPLPPPDSQVKPEQRSAYLAFLYEWQAHLIEGRFHRRLRGETAVRLFGFGAIAVTLSFLPFLVFWITTHGTKLSLDQVATAHQFQPILGLLIAAAFGILGAFFSRLMSFQTKLATLGFDEVMNLYQPRMLLIRLLIGMMGAGIFYYILRAGLVAGTAFPNLATLTIGEPFGWKLNSQGVFLKDGEGTPAANGMMILAPSVELAKLAVWSFLAGFSERLIPETLERTEGRVKEKQG
jgi:predicted outer membrane lipoprotein